MKNSALPDNPLDVDQVDFDNAERGRHQAEQIARWHWRKPALIVVFPYDLTHVDHYWKSRAPEYRDGPGAESFSDLI
jgi:hypothetical protein